MTGFIRIGFHPIIIFMAEKCALSFTFIIILGAWLSAFAMPPEFVEQANRDLSEIQRTAVAGGMASRKCASASEEHPLSERWMQFNDRNWQRFDADRPIELPEVTDKREGTRGSCAIPGMVRVEGQMYSGPSVEGWQDVACTKWISKKFPQRCATFDAEKLKKLLARVPRKSMAFCMDRFEYPNIKGEYPVIMMTYYEAIQICAHEGKRVCTDEEWIFACEGEDARPYPYGFERSPACNADTGWKEPHAERLRDRTSEAAQAELDRIWMGEPSGNRQACRSSFGVYDLTGNIDEWTTNRVSGGHYKGAQKGGYWGPVRARCRPATIAHSEDHYFYQQGVRCCTDR